MVRGKEGLLAGHGALSAKAVLLCTAVVLFEGRLQYTALLQTQLEAGGGAWGHLVWWQGHYLAARQGKSVVAGTHPLASLATLTATADQQRDGRWEIAEEEGLDSRKSFSLISGRAAPGPRRSQGRRLSTPARRRKY